MRRAAGKSRVGTIALKGMLPGTLDGAQYLADAGSPEPILYFDQEDLL